MFKARLNLSLRRFSPLVSRRWNSNNELMNKYMEKLQLKAKNLGFESVEELNKSLKDEIEQKKKQLNLIDPLKELEEKAAQTMEKSRKDHEIKIRSPIDKDEPVLPYKTLDSFLEVEKVKDLNAKEIEYIWRARFQNKEGSLVATLDALKFSKMYALAFKNRTFILPLPKESGGYEMHFVQWSFIGPYTTHCMLTTVAEYKLHKEYAKPHTTLMFHQELVEDKSMVLMNGQVEKESSMSLDEAHLLVLNIQRFYGAMDQTSEAKLQLLKNFNSGNEEFDMDKLIEEATSFD